MHRAGELRLGHYLFTYRPVTYGIIRNTESLKMSRLHGSPPQRPHLSTSIVRVPAFPYQAMNLARQFRQWISSVRSRSGIKRRELGSSAAAALLFLPTSITGGSR